MADIQAPLARGLATIALNSPQMQVSSVRGLAAFSYPTPFMHSSQVVLQAATEVDGPMEVSQVFAFGLARGRINNPRLRVWTYTLDGHDFYVLRLGNDTTFVYDLSTGTWAKWTSPNLPVWRANAGINWIDNIAMGYEDGSNVLVGDDTFGYLYTLDPDQPYDDGTDVDVTPKNFQRVATGQIVAKAREYTPIYEVWLNGSTGIPSPFSTDVDLKYSDDAGHTYVSAQPITVEAGNYVQDVQWQSLGRFCYPGRIFRIEDEGAYARIDGMDVNHGISTS